MITRNHWIVGAALMTGGLVLTGCGTSGHLVAIAPRHHSQVVSPTTSASPTVSGPSNMAVTSPSSSTSSVSPSVSTSSSAIAPPKQPATSINGSPFGYAPSGGKDSLGNIISVEYRIQGKVTQISETTAQLKWMTIQVTKPLQGTNGLTPFPVGKSLTIHFDQSLTHARSLKIVPGSQVDLTFGQFVRHSNKTIVYGSNFSWLSVEKHGSYYNVQGQEVPPQ